MLIASAVTGYVPGGMPVSVAFTRSERSRSRLSFNLADRIFFLLSLSLDVETIPRDDSPK